MNWRGLFTWVLVLMTAFLVSCGPAPKAVVPTYTPAQLERIQDYATGISEKYKRMADLQAEIQSRDWEGAAAIMGGPLGQMLQDMQNLNRNLLPQDQKTARELTRSLFEDFVAIEQAGRDNNLAKALGGFSEIAKDFGKYNQLLSGVS